MKIGNRKLIIDQSLANRLMTLSEGANKLFLFMASSVTDLNRNEYSLQTTRKDISRLIGMSERGITRYIKELVEADVIKTQKTQYTLWIFISSTLISKDSSLATDGQSELSLANSDRSEKVSLAKSGQSDLDAIENIYTPILKARNQVLGFRNLGVHKQVSKPIKNYKPTVYNYTQGVKSLECQEELPLPKDPRVAPRTPCIVSKIIDDPNEFPYINKSVQTSAIWYWAMQRFKKRGLDFVLDGRVLKALLLKYNNVVKFIGDKWEDHRNYIDWYLSNIDPFIARQCLYNINFLSSTSCINQYKAQKPQHVSKIIFTKEQRENMRVTIS